MSPRGDRTQPGHPPLGDDRPLSAGLCRPISVNRSTIVAVPSRPRLCNLSAGEGSGTVTLLSCWKKCLKYSSSIYGSACPSSGSPMALTDVESIEDGPSQYVPGSHYSGRVPNDQENPEFDGNGPVSVFCKAGDIYLHDPMCWHRGAPHLSDRTRYLFQSQYAARWPTCGSTCTTGFPWTMMPCALRVTGS